MKDRLQRWFFLMPIVAVVVVFAAVNPLRDHAQLGDAAVTFYTASGNSGPAPRVEVQAPGATLQVLSRDLSGRLQLTAAAAVFFVAFVTLVCLCALWIYRCHRAPLTKHSRTVYRVGAAIIALVILALVILPRRQVALLLKSFDDLAQTAFANTQVALPWIDPVIGALSLLSAVLLVVTTSIILDGVSSAPAQLADLRRRCAALRTTLAAGAAVLAAAVIVVRALQSWTLSFVVQADELRPIADSWTMALGTYWTLVLVAAYVPAAAVVHYAAISMADQRETKAHDRRTRDQWMEDEGLNVSIKGQVGRALMLLAPWLSGGLLTELGKQFLS
jgi:hypothetical protein